MHIDTGVKTLIHTPATASLVGAETGRERGRTGDPGADRDHRRDPGVPRVAAGRRNHAAIAIAAAKKPGDEWQRRR
ncbi:hypothetical protein Afil01_03150 [Actinorhabdospora filicis]|uniref:Uncharacterized protein n=1 Tax=Actinorhabdospora filicis TaxID=1785913 RepID=A0A9W6SGD1_9ACTN|nr:hypothetical protein Afil01_03150 [Actinorhabdospora filicis]